jgi:hypothetical protein
MDLESVARRLRSLRSRAIQTVVQARQEAMTPIPIPPERGKETPRERPPQTYGRERG